MIIMKFINAKDYTSFTLPQKYHRVEVCYGIIYGYREDGDTDVIARYKDWDWYIPLGIRSEDVSPHYTDAIITST